MPGDLAAIFRDAPGVFARDEPGPRALSARAGDLTCLMAFLPTFLFLILLMTAFMSFSHGTQDVYPTFLGTYVKLTPKIVGLIGVLYGLGSIAGGIAFGALSEK